MKCCPQHLLALTTKTTIGLVMFRIISSRRRNSNNGIVMTYFIAPELE